LTQVNLAIVVLDDFGTIALIVNGGEAPFLQRGEPFPDMITEALSDDTAEAQLEFNDTRLSMSIATATAS
jgi:hypothetical protein